MSPCARDMAVVDAAVPGALPLPDRASHVVLCAILHGALFLPALVSRAIPLIRNPDASLTLRAANSSLIRLPALLSVPLGLLLDAC